MKDFLGNEFTAGDSIVYAKTSGRSVALVRATVISLNESGTVTVQPFTESWNGGRDRTSTSRYVDSRTGKGFDPWAEKNQCHLERDAGYEHKETGEFLTYREFREAEDRFRNEDRPVRELWEAVSDWRKQWEYRQRIFKDYVTVEHKVKPVTLKRTDNIIRVSPAFNVEASSVGKA